MAFEMLALAGGLRHDVDVWVGHIIQMRRVLPISSLPLEACLLLEFVVLRLGLLWNVAVLEVDSGLPGLTYFVLDEVEVWQL